MSEVAITKDNFETEVLNSDIPVVVDFWATWCGPCRMLGPVIAEIAEEYSGKVKVCKINVDDEHELAMKFGVLSIPTVIRFENGKAASKSVGYLPKEQLVNALGL